MLRTFKVRGFRNFHEEMVLDLSTPKSYEFSPKSVENGIVKNAIIYGPNGCGKTNLGKALFDIKTHLSDERIDPSYQVNYISGDSKNNLAEFEYLFQFGKTQVRYIYGKKNVKELIYEKLFINDECVLSIDRRISPLFESTLKETKQLRKEVGSHEISIVKYVKNNTVFSEDSSFLELVNFVDLMTLDRVIRPSISKEVSAYAALIMNPEINLEGFDVKEFEAFLNKMGIPCSLAMMETGIGGERRLVFEFENTKVDFLSAASTGTIGLTDFYFHLWRLKTDLYVATNRTTPFIFVDEFDAFYHHALSKEIVRLLKKEGFQFVLTTHNTSLMTNDLLRPDCYFEMSEKEIKPFSERTSKELRKAHNIEKMYRAGAFNG